MSHMGSFGAGGTSCVDAGCAGNRLVRYTATGAEGTDFNVTITDSAGDPITLADEDYSVGLFSYEATTAVPVCAFPNALAGDRTTTTFRVLTAAVLTAGEVLVFLIVEN